VEFPDLFEGHPEEYIDKLTWAGRAASKRCLSAITDRSLSRFSPLDFTLAVYDYARQA
jgi:hypothetical protein